MSGIIGGSRFFSTTYNQARQRFRAAASTLGAHQEAVEIGVEGPDGAPLTIDLAWLGPRDAQKIVVVSSGTHGIEGYMGSAAQLAVLDQHVPRAEDVALVLLHAINPYGFAFRRRVNEENIDLNRNFLLPGELYEGGAEAYGPFDPLLNPPKAPKPWSAGVFLAQAGVEIARHGLGSLKSVVAGGQYDFPQGVFFGGSRPSNTMRALQTKIPEWFGHAQHLLMIDFHTGLGDFATYKILIDHTSDDPRTEWLTHIFGPDVQPWDAGNGVAYAIRGGLGTWMKASLPRCEVDVLATEFGTVNVLKVITALHLENRAHLHGKPLSRSTERAKDRLMRTFNPLSPGWRDVVVDKGRHVVIQALRAIETDLGD